MKNKPTVLLAAVSCAFALAAGVQEAPVVLMPFREATVAAALDSELSACYYKIGEPFTNGALIAELDKSRYQVAFDRASEHRAFTARVAAEQRELRTKDFASEMELRKAEYEAKIATSEYEETRINLSHCRLIAPFNGKISEMLTQVFETAKPGQPLFRIIEDDRLLAVANLPMGSVRVSERVEIIPENSCAVTGTVYEVSPQADNRTGTVRVRVLVENRKGQMTAGMTGELKTLEAPKAVETVQLPPEKSLDFQSPGEHFDSVQEAFAGVHTITNASRPYVEFTGVHFDRGVLGFVVRRNPSVISIGSIKRVGEFTAGLYDAKGQRLACIEPRQMTLPNYGGSVTNLAHFAPGEYLDAISSKGAVKLILRVETDIRALPVKLEGGGNGGR